ncbi:MAG: organomercurial lyase [Opitutaceae bacterium]|nr:organomercurial lyase [Opitutaceae bacterium]
MKPLRALRTLALSLACGAFLAVGLRAAALSAPAESTPALPRLVDLGADKCIPCKMMAPILAELKKEHAGRLDVVFIDVWKNSDAGKQYGIRVIPTQIFYDASGKERFRHEGFISKQDIVKKWKELGVDLAPKKSAGIVREKPVAPDTRPRDRVCSLCDGDVDARTKTMVRGQSEQRTLCSPHCYFIYQSSLVGADAQAEAGKVSVTDWTNGRLIAATTATYLYGMAANGRPTIRAYADKGAAIRDQAASPGNVVTWDVLRAKELTTRCGFCDRAVYPEDACPVKAGSMHTYGCCTHCAMGVAARLQKDIEVEAGDGLTGEVIRVKTLNGSVAALEPASAVAWFGQMRGPDGSWASAGCFKQAFFANVTNLQKWLDARPTMTGRQITIDQALADKMKLSPEQIAKACKLGECK